MFDLSPMREALTAPRPPQTHPSAWPFMEPVKKSEAPDYYEIIRFPIGRWPICPRPTLLQERRMPGGVGRGEHGLRGVYSGSGGAGLLGPISPLVGK